MLIDLLRARRSIRRFTPQAVEDEKIDTLLRAALLSPSSKATSPWYFVVVRDAQRIAQLAKAKPHGATFLQNAPLAIAVCADPDKSDVWVEDCSIATLLLHLQAVELGLGSCWVQLRLRPHSEGQNASEYVAQLLALPENMQVLALVGIGYPAESKKGHEDADLLFSQVSQERFGQPWHS